MRFRISVREVARDLNVPLDTILSILKDPSFLESLPFSSEHDKKKYISANEYTRVANSDVDLIRTTLEPPKLGQVWPLPKEPPEASYYFWILMNLDKLEDVADYHPRLAFLGISSELELVLNEAHPEGIKRLSAQLSADAERRGRWIRYAPTAAARRHLRTLARANFPPKIKTFLSELFERDGRCRHTREFVSLDEFDAAINNAREFLAFFRGLVYPAALPCANCVGHYELYAVASVFDAPPGAEITRSCSRCNTLIFRYEVPNPDEYFLLR